MIIPLVWSLHRSTTKCLEVKKEYGTRFCTYNKKKAASCHSSEVLFHAPSQNSTDGNDLSLRVK